MNRYCQWFILCACKAKPALYLVWIDLYNREIIGYSSGPNKTAELVQRAFSTVPYNLTRLEWFHTDRGSEFKNHLIDRALNIFDIKRSLSNKGTPYDNAVSEATFKMNWSLNCLITLIGTIRFVFMGRWGTYPHKNTNYQTFKKLSDLVLAYQ